MQRIESSASASFKSALRKGNNKLRYALLRDIARLGARFHIVKAILDSRKKGNDTVVALIGRCCYAFVIAKSTFIAASLLVGMLLAIQSIGSTYLTFRQITKMTEQNELLESQNKVLNLELKLLQSELANSSEQVKLVENQNELIRGQTAEAIASRMREYREQLDSLFPLLQNDSLAVRNSANNQIVHLISMFQRYSILDKDGMTRHERLSPERGYAFKLLATLNLNNKERDEYKVDLSRIVFTYSQLAKAKLPKIELPPKVRLSHSNLYSADFSSGKLDYVILNDANALKANFENAELQFANLMGINGRGADFSNANLGNSNLNFAILTDAIFSGADLRGADFTQSQGIESANFENAKVSKDWNAEWSPRFEAVERENHWVLLRKKR